MEERAEVARSRIEEMEAGELKLKDVERAAATAKRESEVRKGAALASGKRNRVGVFGGGGRERENVEGEKGVACAGDER